MLHFREVIFGENHYECFMKGTLECAVMKVGLIAKKGGTAENVFRPFMVDIAFFIYKKINY